MVGVRPNFMKMTPMASLLSTGLHEMVRCPDEFEQILVHTVQHYDTERGDRTCVLWSPWVVGKLWV